MNRYILTLDEAKSFLNITDNTKDDLITSLLSVVQDDLVNYTQNFFNDAIISVSATFNQGSELSSVYDSIATNYTEIEDYLSVGDVIFTSDTKKNDIYGKITSIVDKEIFLDTYGNVKTTSNQESFYIYRVKYNDDLKYICSRMLNYLITSNEKSSDVSILKSQTVGETSETYLNSNDDSGMNNNGYPSTILSKLNKYLKVILR